MNNFIKTMYAARHQPKSAIQEKNPNRVLGGLKGQGVDSFTMLGEDGQERQIPTQAYVNGIEHKLRKLETSVYQQDKRIRRLTNDQKLDKPAPR
tara:strand:+ start:237 stop:518 length:282 start_codon:yes stop_codon:yes gene_type:complete